MKHSDLIKFLRSNHVFSVMNLPFSHTTMVAIPDDFTDRNMNALTWLAKSYSFDVVRHPRTLEFYKRD